MSMKSHHRVEFKNEIGNKCVIEGAFDPKERLMPFNFVATRSDTMEPRVYFTEREFIKFVDHLVVLRDMAYTNRLHPTHHVTPTIGELPLNRGIVEVRCLNCKDAVYFDPMIASETAWDRLRYPCERIK